MTPEGYKVVRKTEDGKYISAADAGEVVEYAVGQRTERPVVSGNVCGPLAVFKTFNAAKELSLCRAHWQLEMAVFKCQFSPYDGDLELWYYGKNDLFVYRTGVITPDTLLAEWVELVELKGESNV